MLNYKQIWHGINSTLHPFTQLDNSQSPLSQLSQLSQLSPLSNQKGTKHFSFDSRGTNTFKKLVSRLWIHLSIYIFHKFLLNLVLAHLYFYC